MNTTEEALQVSELADTVEATMIKNCHECLEIESCDGCKKWYPVSLVIAVTLVGIGYRKI